MIIAGWRKKFNVVADAGTRACSKCHHETRHFLIQEKREVRLYFIPVARWNGKRLLVCSVCSFQIEPDPEQAALIVRASIDSP
jgi:hypothetical protein